LATRNVSRLARLLICSIIWMGFLVYESDLACALRLIGIEGGGPWCDYQLAEPLKYFGNLALKMLGIPFAVGLGMAACAWIAAGFRPRLSRAGPSRRSRRDFPG
jgi:hypothetical protein